MLQQNYWKKVLKLRESVQRQKDNWYQQRASKQANLQAEKQRRNKETKLFIDWSSHFEVPRAATKKEDR